MNFFYAILLGVIQGVAEFLPISSSGHLAIFKNLFHITEFQNVDMFFDVLLHLGTLFSVLFAYWKDIKELVLEFLTMLHIRKVPAGASYNMDSRRMIGLIIIGTLPLLISALFEDTVEQLGNNLFFIAFALVVTGLVLFVSDRISKGKKTIRQATLFDALLVGGAQMIAVVPGLSRSGSTIAAGQLCGFERTFAVKYSFLLSIPAVLGANILTLFDAIKTGIDWSLVPTYLAGMLTAAVCGYFAIKLLKKIAKSKSFGGFAYYCWGAGIVTLFLAMIS